MLQFASKQLQRDSRKAEKEQMKEQAKVKKVGWLEVWKSAATGPNSLHIFYKQPHFSVEPRVAIGSAQNEAQNCYEVANVFWRL